MALTMTATSASTSNPQNTAIGADAIRNARRAPRRSGTGGGGPPGSCRNPSMTATNPASTAAPISSVLAWMPWIDGGLSNHGTPYCETYHGALGPVADIARITSMPDKNHPRLRAERSTLELVANAVSAASAAPIEAKAPKWCVHLVGVSASS